MTESKTMTTAPQQQLAITPMQMLQMAVEQNADLDKMQQLMALQERWEANEARKAFALAMSEFRANCPIIDKTRDGHNNKYAGLAETIDQIKVSLFDSGLSHSWRVSQADKQISVTTCITHIQGHQECTSIAAPPDTTGSKNSIQAIASTITYLERYGLFALLGLASKEMDDDGVDADIEWITPEQAADLESLIEEVGADRHKFLKYLQAETIDKIRASEFSRAVAALEKKRGPA
jgi:hypothetical protein